MTEYDFSPEAYGRYMDTQNRISEWTGSSQQYPSGDPFTMSHSERGRYRNEFDGASHSTSGRPDHSGRYGSERRGRSRHRRQPSLQRGRSPSHHLHTNMSAAHTPDIYDMNPSHGSRTPSMNAAPHPMHSRQNSRGYDQTYAPSPHPINSRQNSAGYDQAFGPSQPTHPDQPLPEHYPMHPASTPQLSVVPHVPSNASMPYPASHPAMSPHPPHGYASSQNPIAMNISGYSSHYSSRHSSRRPSRYPSRDRSEDSYSSRSYSSDSRYSRYSRSPSRSRMYSSLHPSIRAPTIVQPSHSRPIIVPINGGLGGFVVVPAVGQPLRLLDPKQLQKDQDGRSFLGRMLSPSKWTMGTKRMGSKKRHRSRSRAHRY